MTLWASVRMTSHLNAMIISDLVAEAAARQIIDGDVAHHVVDPDGVLDLDPLGATTLDEALPRLRAAEPELWVLALPVPGRLGAVRGPADLNRAALEESAAVVAVGAGLALVPHPIGPAVQWRIFAAERPFTPATPYDAERALSEAVLTAAATLARLDVAGGERPGAAPTMRLPSVYAPRRRALADRAARLVEACSTALLDQGASISSYEVAVRDRELRQVRDAAVEALCSAVTWARA